MGKYVALLAASAAALAWASTANAADCLNGYRTLGNHVVIACHDMGAPMTSGMSAPVTQEPATTGSISRSPVVASSSGPMIVSDQSQCAPGKYWLMSNPNGEEPIACK